MAAIGGAVKVEPVNTRSGNSSRSRAHSDINNNEASASASAATEDVVHRRVLRSRYLNFKNRISDERDYMSKVDSTKFRAIIEEVETLHQHVQKPREQVADAEALLDIANTLVTSVKVHTTGGLSPSDFISCLLRDFGQQGGPSSNPDDQRNSFCWKDIGSAVSHVFRSASGCSTIVGPMDTELRQRRPVIHRKRARPAESARPQELEKSVTEEKTDTDKNMATMFDILRKNRTVRLEKLILNQNSFAQTVENLFALSFLVKDGRAEVTVDEKGCHFVAPKNAPAANTVLSGEVSYSHFVFRFDFRDWKLMLASLEAGEELMPHRSDVNNSSNAHPDPAAEDTQAQLPTTPIRKLSRNRGLVLQEQTVVEDSPESDDRATRAAAIRKGKRKLR